MVRTSLWVGLLLCASLWLTAASVAQTDTSGDEHLGVSSCKGSPCHGAATNEKKTLGVLQSEYQTWQRYDKHAKAYTVLLSERGEKIAANLGLGRAENAETCLNCHADNVPAAARGVEFHIEDGVGCEACHGGSQRWLGPHVSGRISHADLVKQDGLYPTDNPVQRASLCLNCHLGDETRVITHKIMGAGHPRMPFELQTFTQIEPAHYRIDDVYRSRKVVSKGVQFWAVGQALALERLGTEIVDHKKRGDSAFPELIFFDCQACHHSIANLRWEKRDSTGLAPGMPHVNDANAVMLRVIASRLAPELGQALEGDMIGVQKALSDGDGSAVDAGNRLATDGRKLADVFAQHNFSRDDMRAMLMALVQSDKGADGSDYAMAEQSTMAIASIVDTLNQEGAIDAAQYAGLKRALDQCYAATQKEESYEPARFALAAQAVSQAVPTW